MKKPITKTDFQKKLKAETAIKDARARGKAAMAEAAQVIQRDKQYRAAKGLVQDNAARDKAREKIRTHAELDDPTGWNLNQH